MKKIFLIRHCKAEGQDPSARLTLEGEMQSQELAIFLEHEDIEFVISSPFLRATETISPLCQKLNLNYSVDERLQERLLSTVDLADWMDKLKDTYINLDLKYEGGETSREAMNRGIEVINELINSPFKNSAVVTHGNLMSLILKYFDHRIGFEEWSKLSNPDVYIIGVEDKGIALNRIWM
ncbi:histidine phosphatase family protein [Paenibacillus dakarensis]|uniref:histidine phosphatase family protein n=1 Tax=Paenibacillus dakarensis TaxID=1527293 RepID=UPI0006D532BF|nr:histidine phosphatase family protein [Paenibacillus dakarensis]